MYTSEPWVLKDNREKETKKKKDINTLEFSKFYENYYENKTNKAELLKKFNITEKEFQTLVIKLDLPPKTLKFSYTKMPENFEQIYTKFLENKISKAELLKELGVSSRTLHRWISKKNLPLRSARKVSDKETQKLSTVETKDEKDYLIIINIFNHKLIIRSPFKFTE